VSVVIPEGERIAMLEGRTTAIEDDVKSIRHDVRALTESTTQGFEKLNERLISRPSWPVSLYMTFITSGFVGVLVAYLSNLNQ
jgi:hypothetical protein